MIASRSHHRRGLMKRIFISSAMAIIAATLLSAQSRRTVTTRPFNVVEATIPQMQAAMKSGQITSHDLVLLYLARIGMYEEKLHAAVFVNPNALKEADELC